MQKERKYFYASFAKDGVEKSLLEMHWEKIKKQKNGEILFLNRAEKLTQCG